MTIHLFNQVAVFEKLGLNMASDEMLPLGVKLILVVRDYWKFVNRMNLDAPSQAGIVSLEMFLLVDLFTIVVIVLKAMIPYGREQTHYLFSLFFK